MQCVLLQGLCDSKSPRVFSSDNQVGDRWRPRQETSCERASSSSSRMHIDFARRINGDRDDISEAELAKKLQQAGGAHTPEYYDFGGGAIRAAAGADSHEKEADGGDRGTSGGAGAGDETGWE